MIAYYFVVAGIQSFDKNNSEQAFGDWVIAGLRAYKYDITFWNLWKLCDF